jgi:phosphate transport system protein
MVSNESSPVDEHHETRHHFSEILDEIRNGMVEMGSLIVENARRAGIAMVESRLELVPDVIAADDEVDRRYAELEHLTFETLARQQPVAGDLRFLVSATRVLYELERCGDLVVNLANVLDRIHGFPESPNLRNRLDRLVDESIGLFERAIEALRVMDPDAGARLDVEDDIVDDLVAEFYHQIGRESEAIGLESGIALTRIGRFLERIADHGVNIGENTTYVVTSEFPGGSA